jgi:L-serine dehydratase
MHSIKEIFTIGHGPSSSHTMGPRKAAEMFLDKMPEATNYRVTLYGSLAATGKGHLTDMVIKDVFQGRSYELVWEPKVLFIKKPGKVVWRFLSGMNSSTPLALPQLKPPIHHTAASNPPVNGSSFVS